MIFQTDPSKWKVFAAYGLRDNVADPSILCDPETVKAASVSKFLMYTTLSVPGDAGRLI